MQITDDQQYRMQEQVAELSYRVWELTEELNVVYSQNQRFRDEIQRLQSTVIRSRHEDRVEYFYEEDR